MEYIGRSKAVDPFEERKRRTWCITVCGRVEVHKTSHRRGELALLAVLVSLLENLLTQLLTRHVGGRTKSAIKRRRGPIFLLTFCGSTSFPQGQ